ncbi:Pleckstrin homology domain-containing protein [Dactylonectria estremocensis]|uniref:Pleckstrin homology domain-containing protein n=1 Tax=Dactylonectria estremocensis TaxID=1079267 RepID=A0A9P9J7Q0_9HYPO|nr:Pleckstrin homology domain-containing protein [Dactylonectria estremocensis]
MAEEQKKIEVPVETKPELAPAPVVEPVVETKPEETPKVDETVATEDKPVEESKPAETAEETPAEAVEEAKPIEEGHLSHKAQGLSFPKNLIASKEFFFFGVEAIEAKTLAAYLKAEKSVETAHSNIAWATETGKGLLFVGDKKTPSSVISLADATEPETDGSHKFHFTSKGNKHTFKASNPSERDNWVAQLKAKIAEAKELAVTVTESESYKATIESFKPAPPAKKEEKPVEAPKEEAPATDEVVAPVVAEETPKEEAVEERKKEEVKSEEPKRRSASRKRASFFGFGKKEEKKEEVKPTEETPVADETKPVEETPVVVEETPKIEEAPVVAPVIAPVVVDDKPTEVAPIAEDAPVAEDKPVESPKEKPTATKRNSFFGGVFSKKEKKTPELKPTEPVDAPKESEAAETAPVIPPVEATTPLAVDVTAPPPAEATETPEVVATEPVPEVKKDIKEKRKSSLPFAFGKRDKSPAPAEGEEKPSKSAFSKFRATIKGKSAAKAEEKPEEKAAEEPVKEDVKEEDVKPVEEVKPTEEAPKTEETKPENVAATTTPAVTAAA